MYVRIRWNEEFIRLRGAGAVLSGTLGLQEDVTFRLSKWDPENRRRTYGEPEVLGRGGGKNA